MKKKLKITVIQGPNLNMLGTREPHIYGQMTLDDIHKQMQLAADQAKVEIEFFQSNFEGELVDKIQECYGESNGIIINPAAYTHSSIAIRDALASLNIPIIEVHISNTARREEFRQKNLISEVVEGKIMGFGPVGYHLAMLGMLQIFGQMQAVKTSKKNG